MTPYHYGWVYWRTHTWISPLLVKAFAFLAVTPSEPLMKIATFNVNNLNKRLVNLLDWLRASRPEGRLLRRLARAKIMEWRRDTCARLPTSFNAHGPAG